MIKIKKKKKKSQEIHSTFRDSFLANFSVGEELSFSKPMNIFDSDYTREVGRQDWSRIEVSVSETEQAKRGHTHLPPQATMGLLYHYHLPLCLDSPAQ